VKATVVTTMIVTGGMLICKLLVFLASHLYASTPLL
jgi:hypothetical protein